MTTNDSTASSTEKKAVAEQETNIYKTLFMVTAPVTALLAGACVWMGVQLSSTSRRARQRREPRRPPRRCRRLSRAPNPARRTRTTWRS